MGISLYEHNETAYKSVVAFRLCEDEEVSEAIGLKVWTFT